MVFSKAGNELFNASINDNNAGALNGRTIPFVPGIQHALATSTSHLDLHCWHLRFCHCSSTAIEGAIKHHSFTGLTFERSNTPHDPLCAGCIAGKHHFIDDFSRYHRIYFLHKKSDALLAYKEFKAEAELLTGKQIKKLRDDKGGGSTC